jgi:acetyl esterase/lipase
MKSQAIFAAIIITFIATATLAQQSRQTPQVPEGTKIYRDVPYVTNGHERQKLDLYLPNGSTGSPSGSTSLTILSKSKDRAQSREEGKKVPLIIWIHGGAWLEGSKENRIPSDYPADGYAVASINYRLSQHALFPAQIEDCKAAVRWLRANAEKYNIDPNRFGAWGESAGGHLAAMLGTTGDVNEFDKGEHRGVSSRVQCVADFFGPTDFLQMDEHRLADGMVHNTADSPEARLVGGPIQENKEKAARANPITYVSKDDPPFLIVHGDADQLVPHHQSELLEAALKKAGVPVTLYTVKGEGHGGFKDPKAAELTKEFFAKHLKGKQR